MISPLSIFGDFLQFAEAARLPPRSFDDFFDVGLPVRLAAGVSAAFAKPVPLGGEVFGVCLGVSNSFKIKFSGLWSPFILPRVTTVLFSICSLRQGGDRLRDESPPLASQLLVARVFDPRPFCLFLV